LTLSLKTEHFLAKDRFVESPRFTAACGGVQTRARAGRSMSQDIP
jgi:hypothetical protein